MNIDELLDAVKKVRGLESDNALAKELGVSRQRVSSWRNGHRHPEPVTCAAIAGLAGLPLAQVLGIVGEARAISREEKSVWRKLAASAAVIFLLLGAAPLPGHASGAAQRAADGFSSHSPGTYCLLCPQNAAGSPYPE